MFTNLTPQPTPVPAAFEVMRAGLLNHSAITQRHLSAVGYLVRTAGVQAQSGLTGSAADPLLAQQAMALTTLADNVVGMARVLSDLHTRSASELLRWWELQLRTAAPWQDETASQTTPPPALPAGDPVPATTAATPKPARKRAARSRKTATGKTSAAAPAKPARKAPVARKTAAKKSATSARARTRKA